MGTSIGVVGAGSWGTALANLLAGKGFPVSLWVFESDLCELMKKQRVNTFFLPGVNLEERVFPTNSLAEACEGKTIIVSAVPSHIVRTVISQIIPYLDHNPSIVSATKGIENETLLTISGVLKEVLPLPLHNNLAFLSGPSFAKEVSKKMPTAAAIASENLDLSERMQKVFATHYFRIYVNSDVTGVELGGAVKNVIAIAAGVVDGLGLGNNTRAALITRGLAEIARLGVKMGANPLTFSGLAGLGDLVLTCTGDLSRNRMVGIELGKGKKLSDILASTKMVAEGVKTAWSVNNLAKKLGVKMPISEQVYSLLYDGKSPHKALTELMLRDLRSELD